VRLQVFAYQIYLSNFVKVCEPKNNLHEEV